MIEEQPWTTDRYSNGALSHAVPGELRRLRALERQLDPTTTAILADRDLPPSPRCLELGAGAGSVTRWLAGRYPTGHVTAVDIDARYLDPAWAPNLTVCEDDVRTLDFAPGSFDLIHARTLFMHLPEREDLISRAAKWLAPDGWIVLEDISTFPSESSPHPEWSKVLQAMRVFLQREGGDSEWVRRRQPALLAEAGLSDLGLSAKVFTVGDGGPAEEFWRAFLTQVRPVLTAQGLLTHEEIDGALALFDEPSFVDTAECLMSAWGRSPA